MILRVHGQDPARTAQFSVAISKTATQVLSDRGAKVSSAKALLWR